MRSSESELCVLEPLADGARAPLVLRPKQAGLELQPHFALAKACVEEHLHVHGAILFRGFAIDAVAGFQRFCQSFAARLLDYDYASTPRSQVEGAVYSSTEYPAHQTIPLHSEQSYSRTWPMKIWFYSQIVAAEGGETPIADCRAVYQRIPAGIRARFERDGVMYVRNFGGGLDLPWSQVFRTEDPRAVEAFCRTQGIACEWSDDGELRTRQTCQASARHPTTNEPVWFNQAHLFHVSSLEPEIREALEDSLEPDELPRNAFYGDGKPIEDGVLDEVRHVLLNARLVFPWQRDDVLMLDNMLTAHGRSAFAGARKVAVAMAQPMSSQGDSAARAS